MSLAEGRITRVARRLLGRTGHGICLAASVGLAMAVASGPAALPTSGALSLASSVRPQGSAADYTYGVEPATNGKPDGRAQLSFVTAPGAQIRDEIAVLNFSTQALHLQMTTADALNTASGGYSLVPDGTKSVFVGSWTRVGDLGAADTIVVPPRGPKGPSYRILPVTITVPRNAPPGDHDGGIVAGLEAEGSTTTGQRITVDQRVGTRIFLRISGPLRPDLAIRHVHVTWHGSRSPFSAGTATVRYTITNVGNAQLGGKQTVRISGVLGSATTTKVPALSLLLPGYSVTETATVHGAYPGFVMTAKVTVKPLVVTGQPDPNLPAQFAGKTSFVAIPWPLLILLALVIAIGFLVRRRLRPSGGDSTQVESPEHGSPASPAAARLQRPAGRR